MNVASSAASKIEEQEDGRFAITFDHQVLQFQQVKLSFLEHLKGDVFGQKNNKTVAETLAHKRYAKFVGLISAEHPNSADTPLGEFLLGLKSSGNLSYKRFLNAYGDGSYCTFRMERSPLSRKKGLYCYRLTGKVVYVGRSYDPFEKRINQGYGKIHPKNCFLDGQATNCHLNALIASNVVGISLFVCPLESDTEIERLERRIIHLLQPQWNIALKYD